MTDTHDTTASIPKSEAHDARNRWLGIALAVVAATALAIAALSSHWLISLYGGGDDQGTRMSLRASYTCNSGECVPLANGDLDNLVQTSAAFAPAGWVTFVASLVAAAFLALSLTFALARRRPDWPMAPTTIAFLGAAIAIISGCVFVATKPAGAALGLGWAFPVFCVGAVCGIAGSQLLARALRPVDPDLLADSFDPDDF
jgi:hypothetical protein